MQRRSPWRSRFHRMAAANLEHVGVAESRDVEGLDGSVFPKRVQERPDLGGALALVVEHLADGVVRDAAQRQPA